MSDRVETPNAVQQDTASILLVDDLRHFKPEIIRSCEPGTYIRVCRSSQSAVETLASDERVWDQVWLDHDLGMQDGKDDTTMEVLDYLLFRHQEGNPVRVVNFIIHSANPVGVKNIALALQSMGRDSVITDPSYFFNVPTEESDIPTDETQTRASI